LSAITGFAAAPGIAAVEQAVTTLMDDFAYTVYNFSVPVEQTK
jgi:hypothetical protein